MLCDVELLSYLEASWTWPACFPFYCLEFVASCLWRPVVEFLNHHRPATHTGSTGILLSPSERSVEGLKKHSRWGHTDGHDISVTDSGWLSRSAAAAAAAWWGYTPFLWSVVSGGDGAGEWPSIIHLKRDCCPPVSFIPPIMEPSSSPEKKWVLIISCQ